MNVLNIRSLALTCILWIVAAGLLAQEGVSGWTYIEVDSQKTKWGDYDDPEWLRYFGLDMGDLNGDGNLDIVTGRWVYLNPGNVMTGGWKKVDLGTNVDGILVMEVDSDAYADVIAQALPEVFWLEAANADATLWNSLKIGEIPATSHTNSQGFEKAQLIPGGKPELLIAGNGDVYCIEIPDNPENVPWGKTLIGKNTSDEGIGTGDIDGDGDTDVVAGRRPAGEDEPKILVWFENPGVLADNWISREIGATTHPIDRIEVADLNGDERADIILTEERYPGLEPDAFLYWFEQPENSGTEWERHTIVQQYSMNNLDVADLDHDGDMDLITNEHKGERLELQLWKNDGRGMFSKQLLDTGKENHLGTQLADLDGDGDLDIFGAAWDNYRWMHVWRNDELSSPREGQVFREYIWTAKKLDTGERFLRVGGKLDYRKNKDLGRKIRKTGWISLARHTDLENATGAELIIDHLQSHGGTTGLEVQIGNSSWLPVPSPATLPDPKSAYMFHHNARVAIPLSSLNKGENIRFRMRVDPEHPWNWPQNLIYSVVLKIRYADKTRFRGVVHSLDKSPVTNNNFHFLLESTEQERVKKVEYFGKYLDADYVGNGLYADWKLYYREDSVCGLIGNSDKAPFDITWNTEWIPDQQQPIEVLARVHLDNGLICHARLEKGLQLERDYSVKLLRPFAVPQNWVTREDRFSEKFRVADTTRIREALITWSSWSPCYNEGILLNGDTLTQPVNARPCYDYFIHREAIDPSKLIAGENTLTTLKTPLRNGSMVHGMEVQWPGIMVKVKYKTKLSSPHFFDVSYEDRPHFLVKTQTANYYYDKKGGAFSRIIDRAGNDWIGFRIEPWNIYPASAASSFRGLPNLVYGSADAGAGHPGFDKCTSLVIARNQIRTTSLSGSWAWNWTFAPDHAVLTMEKVHPQDHYWFLYEGCPGGTYKPQNYFFGTDKTNTSAELPDYYAGAPLTGNFQFLYAADSSVGRSFFILQVQDDDLPDLVSYLGNSEKGTGSENGMTVFGFGRSGATPLLSKPQKFVIGLLDIPVREDIPGKMKKQMERLLPLSLERKK